MVIAAERPPGPGPNTDSLVSLLAAQGPRQRGNQVIGTGLLAISNPVSPGANTR